VNLKKKYFLIFTYEASSHGGIQWKLLGEYKKETKIFTSKGGYQVNLKKKQKYLHVLKIRK
jgi:DNA-binding transcriptional regulator WhiA